MAVIITDNRVDPTNGEADSTTGWTSSISASLVTANPSPVELTGCLAMVVSTTTQDIYLGITSRDMSAGELVYVWQLPNGIMDTEANGGQGVTLYDGTNNIGYHVGGSDKAGFRHNTASVAWQCMLLDTGSLPATFTARAGSEAALTKTAITGVGAMYSTLAKSVGGAVNCFTDIIRIGNDGLTITGGGVGTEGKFSEIAVDDASDASLKAFGICHEVASGVYGLQGPLTFGDSAGTGSVDFLDKSVTVVFEDRGIGTDKYYIDVVSNATGTTDYQLGTKVGADGGADGVSLVCPVGVGARFDGSDPTVESVLLYGGGFTNYDQSFIFSSDATNAPNHEVFAYSFSGCAQIDPGLIQFKNNTITNTADALGGLLGNRDLDLLSFNSDGTGHGIYITTVGTYSYTDVETAGYGADGTTDAFIYNNSGGAVTINKSGGGTFTVRNGTSATTIIVADPAVLTVNVADEETGLAIEGAAVTLPVKAGGSYPFEASVTITSTGGVATVTHTGHGFNTNHKVAIDGANENEYNRIKTITVTGINDYTYPVAGTPTSPATGTITSTAILIDGITNVSGTINDSRVYGVNQNFDGVVQRGSVLPIYKARPVSATVDKVAGATLNILLTKD